MSYTMENGDSLYADIAELERELNYLKELYSYNIGILDYSIAEFQKENEKLKKENDELEDLVHNLGGRKCEICGKGNWELGLTELEMDYDDTTGFHCCQGQECLRQFWKSLPQLRGRCNEDTEDNE